MSAKSYKVRVVRTGDTQETWDDFTPEALQEMLAYAATPKPHTDDRHGKPAAYFKAILDKWPNVAGSHPLGEGVSVEIEEA